MLTLSSCSTSVLSSSSSTRKGYLMDLGLGALLFGLVVSTIAFIFFWAFDRSHLVATCAGWIITTLVALPVLLVAPAPAVSLGLSVYFGASLGLIFPASIFGLVALRHKKRQKATDEVT